MKLADSNITKANWFDTKDNPFTSKVIFGAIFAQSVIIVTLLIGSTILYTALGLPAESADKITKALLNEGFGPYSFLSAALVTILGNGIYLIVRDASYLSLVNAFRVHIQTYLIGLMLTVFLIGYKSSGLLNALDYKFTFAIIVLVLSVTGITNWIRKRGEDNAEIVGYIYIATLIMVVLFSQDIITCLKETFGWA